MKREDIEHLAALSRIELSEERVEAFMHEFDDILGYVADIKEAAGAAPLVPQAGAVRNVFREDVATPNPGLYTEALLDAAPSRKGRYVEVKKILGENK